MPSSVIGRPISGSLTPPSAVVTCSGVGSGELMSSWYARPGGRTRRAPALPAHVIAVGRTGAQDVTVDKALEINSRPSRPSSRQRCLPFAAADHGAGRRVEDEPPEVRVGLEVKQPARLVQTARGGVERAGDALAVQPVVL